ncbi:MAG: SUF system NifU family Fe-S cluster assembly protein [Actinobacteria bacterium]|nr:SUF system NifU family Fe-S cluster assembly protein [Actinomycetota bacterium]
MGLDDLYQQIILDHYRNPRHRGHLDDPGMSVDHQNPLCGDQVHLDVTIRDGRIVELAHAGDGCSISQASASMMSEAAHGKSIEDAHRAIDNVLALIHGEAPADEDLLGDAVALEGVAKYPARVRCALLGWMALRDALPAPSHAEKGAGVGQQ